MDLEKENRTLRRLLCFKIAGSKGYYDDGELQDNTEKPFIDFNTKQKWNQLKLRINSI